MFSDDILEKIFLDPEVKKIPIGYQSTMIRIIEKVLEKSNAVEFQSIYSGEE